MAPVKRSYDSPLRRDQARATQMAIAAAALALFSERGYTRTSVELIATRAGVSRANVFKSVGGKPQLLRAAYRLAVRGAQPDIPLGQQARAREILSDPDPSRLLAGYAAVVAELAPRLAPVYRAIAGAADADPQAAKLWSELQEERRVGARGIARALDRLGELRNGLSRSRAADILWILNDPGLHHKLVTERGWSEAAFRDWLTHSMQTQLLRATSW